MVPLNFDALTPLSLNPQRWQGALLSLFSAPQLGQNTLADLPGKVTTMIARYQVNAAAPSQRASSRRASTAVGRSEHHCASEGVGVFAIGCRQSLA